jgi:hypothetical protein
MQLHSCQRRKYNVFLNYEHIFFHKQLFSSFTYRNDIQEIQWIFENIYWWQTNNVTFWQTVWFPFLQHQSPIFKKQYFIITWILCLDLSYDSIHKSLFCRWPNLNRCKLLTNKLKLQGFLLSSFHSACRKFYILLRSSLPV